MSYSVQRNNNGRVIEKSLNPGQSIGLTISESLGAIYDDYTTNINTLSLNNQIVNATANELNKTIVTPGIASNNKILVLDSSKNISGINSLSCNDIIINNISLNYLFENNLNVYLNSIIPGTANPTRTLVLDSNKNIGTINNISNNEVYIQNSKLDTNKTYYNNLYKLTNNSIPNTNIWTSVCWADNLNLYVAVSNTGSGNRVMTSPDGIDWTSRTSTADNNWTSVCYSSQLKLLVAVSNTGEGNRVMTSINGILWTSRTSAADNNWTSVCYSPELVLFVAVSNSGTNNRVMTSLDGINWTARVSAVNNNWTSVCYSTELNLFVAVSNSGTNNRVMTSNNGINWVSRTSAADNNWTSVCYSSELNLFVAVANSGTNRIMKSTDGINWTLVSISLINNWSQIIWLNQFQYFVAIANSYSDSPIIVSKDGINWNPINNKLNNKLSTICWSYSLKKICLLTTNEDAIKCLNTFSLTNMNVQLNMATYSIYWANTLNLFINVGNNKVLTSSNGLDWTTRTVPTIQWNSIIYSSELSLLVVVGNTNAVLTSTDAITWTSRTVTSTCNWISVCYGGPIDNKLFVAVAQNASTASIAIMTSTDGINWTNRTAAGNGTWWQVIWANELSLFVCVGSSTGSRVMTSPDGINWTTRTAAAENNWKSVCWSSELNLLLAISDSNTSNQLMYSRNGINWTGIDCPGGSWYSIKWISQLQIFIAVGIHTGLPTNTIIYSPNGFTWHVRQNPYNVQVRSFDFSPSLNTFIFGSASTMNVANCFMTSYTVNNNNIYSLISDYTIQTMNMNNLIKSNIVKMSTIKYSINKWYNSTLSLQKQYSSIFWAGYPLNQFLLTSIDGTYKLSTLTNINVTTEISNSSSFAINTACWAQEIQTAVALGNSSTIIYYNSTGWQSTTVSPASNNWTSVCWSSDLNLFVAVSNTGYKNRVITSFDGTIWTIQESPNNNWTSICYSPELNLFVAVANSGTGNRVMTSNDSLTWISRTSAADNNWTSVCWASHLSLFVAVSNSGTGNRIMTSSDGINWAINNSPADNNWNSIIYIPELQLLVSVASSGTKRLMYSRDGTNWTLVTLSLNNSWTSVCWSSEYGILVMVSSDGTNRINRSHFFRLTALNSITNQMLTTNNNNNVIFGAQQLPTLTHKLEYGPSNSGSNSFSLNSAASKNLISIDQNRLTLNSANISINISDHNGIDGGLAINNTLITSTANQINILSKLVVGTCQANKPISADSLGFISGINSISCNSYTIPSIFSNTNTGTVNPLSILIPNNNKEINNLNSLGTNTLQIKNTTIKTSPNKNTVSNYLYNITITKGNVVRSASQIPYICWADKLKIFVAVSGGYSLISSDGINWTTYSITGPSDLSIVCWSSALNLFVAAGNFASTSFYYSSDGKTWLSTTVPNGVYTIAWSNTLNMFAALAYSASSVNCILTSTNGINWTTRTGAIAQWNQIIYAKNKFVGIGTNSLITSTDGITWTNTTITGSWIGIAYSPQVDLFVIIARSGTNTAYISTSTDLVNWTTRTHSAITNFTLAFITYVQELNLFIIAGSSATNNILYSSDGINWYFKNSPYSVAYKSIAWSPLLYKLAFGTTSNYVITTKSTLTNIYRNENYSICNTNLEYNLNQNAKSQGMLTNIVNNFITRTKPNSNTLTAICRSDELNIFVAISNSGTNNRVITSLDGTNWTAQTTPVDNNWTSICYSSYLVTFVAVSNSGTGNRVMTSNDAINWTAQTTLVDNNWTSVCWSPELALFVAVSNSGSSDRVMTSSNGINWTSQTTPVDNNWTSVCWSSELALFVAVSNTGTNNRVMTSTDGITWTARTSIADNNWTSVCWASTMNLFIAVANSGTKRIMYSEDGIVWSNNYKNNSTNYSMMKRINSMNWNNIIWVHELNSVIAVSNSANGNCIMTSVDGINWYLQKFIINKNLIGLAWSKTLGLLCGISSDAIIQSTIIYAAENTAITAYPNQLYIDNKNKRIGLGISPSYQLQLSTDSAAKLSSSTWTVSSDIRLKENIIDADLDKCYNDIKNLPLKRYTWKSDIYNDEQVNDRSKLGWIADDVENILPNCIKKINAFGYEDCRSLNTDQIINSLYGAIKKLMSISEEKQKIIDDLKAKKNILKEYLDSIEVVIE